MRIALLAATALVALSPLAVAQDQIVATEPATKVRVNDQNAPGARLHYDLPCRVSPEGTCITEPPAYPPHRPRP